MRKIISNIGFIVILALLNGCAYYNTFYNAKKFYKEATKERKKRLRTQVVELSPEEKEQLRRRGDLASLQGSKPGTQEMQNYQRAIEKASSVLEFYPNGKWIDDALILLGQCFYYRGEYSKAQRKFEEIIQLYPDSKYIPEARLFSAKNYLGLAEFDRAGQLFRAYALDDKMPKQLREEAKYELAGLYYEKANYELALEEYRVTAKESDDKLIRAMSLYRMGECLIFLKQFEEAPQVFRRVINVSPNEDFKFQAAYKLGEAQSLVGDYELAIRTFSDLLSREMEAKRIPMIKLQLANNLRFNGNMEDAIKWYENVIEEHKRTDASARSYFALGEIAEFVNGDYKKAKENYDLVRAERANSLVAPDARSRSENIKLLLDLNIDINKLLGIAEADSMTDGDDDKNGKRDKREKRDDAPINLSSEGMWINYTGRDRPPPTTLGDLTDLDLQRASSRPAPAAGDSLNAEGHTAAAVVDSAALAAQNAKAEEAKARQLGEKRLALAELLLFSFDKADSAFALYWKVYENSTDTLLASRALYSIGYMCQTVYQDTTLADSVLTLLIDLYSKTAHADGARKYLGIPLLSEAVDSAKVLFKKAEEKYWAEKDTLGALKLYGDVIERYPESQFALKAEYAIGWIHENSLYDFESAVSSYTKLVKMSPESEFAKVVKPKLDAYEKALKEEEAKQKAIADSLANLAASQAAGDSLGEAAVADSNAISIPDSLLTNRPVPSTQPDTSTAMMGTGAPPDSSGSQVLLDSLEKAHSAALREAEPAKSDTTGLRDRMLQEKRILEDELRTTGRPETAPEEMRKRETPDSSRKAILE